ncbi:MAG: DNA polymerase III subunit epsilon [Alphaproteobacteria bacterium]|jgi:DNA polymerase-3 subunit epsilon|nr:DNA polymerase III subunit epsilon [Alphaproteobacteria bacterium]
MNRKILLDVETTGFYYDRDDKIVELACVEIFDDKQMQAEFHYYINPQRDIPAETTKVHGISNEMVKDSPVFAGVVEEFLNFVGDSEIIAHNAKFDMSFINAELKKVGKDIINPNRFIDTLKLAQDKFPGQRNNLDILCKRLGISLDSRKDHHGALIDTRLLGEVYIQLTGGQKSMFDTEFSATDNVALGKILSYDNSNFTYRKFDLTAEQIENHKNFLTKIKNPKWL